PDWIDHEGAGGAVANALRALKQAQQSSDLRFRVVLHYGKVFVGGGANLGEESLLGNEVNFAFRAEKLAGRLGVLRLLTETASQQISPQLPTESCGRHSLTSFEGDYAFFTF